MTPEFTEAMAMIKAKAFVQMLMDVDKERIEYLEDKITKLQAQLKGDKKMAIAADWGTGTGTVVNKQPVSGRKMAWSWSRLSCFEECPKKFQHMNILKDVPFVSSAAMDRGKSIHQSLEDNVLLGTPLPDILEHMKGLLNGIRAAQGAELIVESKLAFDESMNRTGYFAKDVWLRVIMDLAIVERERKRATILDWKTGKVKEYSDQLALCAMAGFAIWPEVDEITTAYMWVDHAPQKTQAHFTRDQYESLLLKFGDRSEMIQLTVEAGSWNATPNQYCKWCPLTKHQCMHKP